MIEPRKTENKIIYNNKKKYYYICNIDIYYKCNTKTKLQMEYKNGVRHIFCDHRKQNGIVITESCLRVVRGCLYVFDGIFLQIKTEFETFILR